MPSTAIRRLQRHARKLMPDSLTGTAPDNTSVIVDHVKLEAKTGIAANSPDEQDQTTHVQRALLYTLPSAPVVSGWTVAVNAVTWYVIDDDHMATERALTRYGLLRDAGNNVMRNVYLYTLDRATGLDTKAGPYVVSVAYRNISPEQSAGEGSNTRRVDATLTGDDQFPAEPGQLFRIEMGGGAYLGGDVVDVNRSAPGKTTATVRITRGQAQPERRSY